MDLELIQTALNVLRACTERREPRREDVELLKGKLGPEADGMEADDLARTIIERCLRESGKAAGGRG